MGIASLTFDDVLAREGLPPMRRAEPRTLQVNVGKRCNQACHHCHVDAGPKRTEVMTPETAESVLAVLERNPGLATMDVTGEKRKLVTSRIAPVIPKPRNANPTTAKRLAISTMCCLS